MKAHKEIKYEDLNITDIAARLNSLSDSESINTYRSSDDVNIMEKYDPSSNTFISISPAPNTKSSPTNDSFSDESSLSFKKSQNKNNNASKSFIKFDRNPIDQNKLLALLSDVDKKKLHE